MASLILWRHLRNSEVASLYIENVRAVQMPKGIIFCDHHQSVSLGHWEQSHLAAETLVLTYEMRIIIVLTSLCGCHKTVMSLKKMCVCVCPCMCVYHIQKTANSI